MKVFVSDSRSSRQTSKTQKNLTASNLQTTLHAPHCIHFSGSILCGTLFSPIMASVGHTFLHFPHAVHISSSMLYLMSALQTPAGHRFSLIWASYSSLKYLIVLKTGLGAVWPSPHRDVEIIFLLKFSRNSISPSLPFPSVISVNLFKRILFN